MRQSGFGTVAGNEMTMMFAHGDRDSALQVFQSCWWLITILCSTIILLLSGALFFVPMAQLLRLNQISEIDTKWIIFYMGASVLLGQLEMLLQSAAKSALTDEAMHKVYDEASKQRVRPFGHEQLGNLAGSRGRIEHRRHAEFAAAGAVARPIADVRAALGRRGGENPCPSQRRRSGHYPKGLITIYPNVSCANASYQPSASRAARRRISALSPTLLTKLWVILIVPATGSKLMALLTASSGARKV